MPLKVKTPKTPKVQKAAMADKKPGARFAFLNQRDEGPVEILVYEDIGKDPWTGEGMDGKSFADKLATIDTTRDLVMRVNSRGGDVFDGLAIYNQLKQWKGRKVGKVDGIAASIASVLLMGCDEVQMPPTSQMFIHDAMAYAGYINAQEAAVLTAELNTTSDMLAGIYAEKTGMDKEQCRQWMKDTKLMTGDECEELGFCDTLIEGEAIYNFSPEDISQIRMMCRAGSEQTTGGKPTQPKEPLMNRDKIIALLKKHGATVDEKATDEQLVEQLNTLLAKKPEPDTAVLTSLQTQIAALQAKNDAERKDRIERFVDKCVVEDRITLAQRDFWVGLALKDEAVLKQLAEMPERPPGAPTRADIKADASVADKARHFNSTGLDPMSRAQFYKRNSADLLDFCASGDIHRMLNAAGDNTISSGVQRQVILSEIVRAFAAKIFPLRAFSTVFTNVALEGTDKVNVPYYALETAASTDWNAANGYVDGTTATDTREVTIDKRKYQSMRITSSELRRQPFLNVLQLMKLKAEKLGVDVFKDVLSVVTAANYTGNPVAKASDAFNSEDVVTVRTTVGGSSYNWPEVGRSLFLDVAYDGALLKDQTIRLAYAFAGNVAQTGKIPQILGFDYYTSPNIPDNSENLVGFAAMPSSLLVATSPIQPHPEVQKLLSLYQVIVDPDTGIAMEHRIRANTQLDYAAESIECNYGYQYGNKAALVRITSA